MHLSESSFLGVFKGADYEFVVEITKGVQLGVILPSY